MQIVVSGKYSSDVAESALRFINDLRDRIKRIDLSQVAAGLDSLVYFPVIASDELALPVKSHRSFSGKERAEFVNVEIPHAAWIKADDGGKRDLLLAGLVRAVAADYS